MRSIFNYDTLGKPCKGVCRSGTVKVCLAPEPNWQATSHRKIWMKTINSREIHLISRPDGLPRPENFAVVETSLAEPGPGEVLVRNIYLSVDPAMRPPLTNGQTQLNTPMTGSALGRVVESRHDQFVPGDHVISRKGMRDYCVVAAKNLEKIETSSEPLSTHLHLLGATGLTAYGGLLVTGELKEQETVFVSAAAGAVGSVAGQIARIKQCRVVGSCGSDEKVRYITEELGFDYGINYKTGSLARELHIACPEGIDVYFDNVGGAHLDAAVGQMRPLGRIPLCGMISSYNNKGARSEGVTKLSNMIYNRVMMRGFVVYEFAPMRDRFLADMRQWLAEGKIKYRETIMEGLENTPNALIGLFTGENIGKMLVHLADE